MSEFECRNGHLMAPSDGPFCRICGSRVYTMDGMTNAQLRRMEQDDERDDERDDLDDDEKEDDDAD